MDYSILKEAGLTDGETKVYVAMLELGPSTTGPIIERSGIARSIIYQILDRLAQKGLVSFIVKEKTKHFQAADPQRILDYLNEREKNIQKTREKVNELLPRLMMLEKSAKPSEVQVFEGYQGMVTVHERTYEKLGRGEEYYYFGIPSEQPPRFHTYWQRDHRRRIKAGINCRLLYNQSTPLGVLANRNKYAGCEARYMTTGVTTPSWIMGYKDTTVIGIPSGRSISIEIVNQEIADSFRNYFDEFWRLSKPLSPRKGLGK